MRRRLTFLLCVILPLLAAERAAAQASRSVVAMTLTQTDLGGGRVYLPMRFGNVAGAMRLDTGATTTRLRRAPWNKDFPVVGQSRSTGAFGQTTLCEDVEAANVALKAVEGNDIARGKYEVARCAADDGDDLLGLDFFKNARFTLDFARREMVFFGAPFGGTQRPFRLLGPEKRLVGVDFRAGALAAIGLFDTGAEICAVDRAFVLKHRRLFAPTKERIGASEASGRKFASRLYKIKEIDLGAGRIARDVYALVYDFGPLRAALGRETSFILGFNLLSQFAWELDFRAADAPLWDARAK